MDFIGMAIELEEKTISAYKGLADQCLSHEGILRIMNMLIQDQEKHLQNLSRMQDIELQDKDVPGIFKSVQSLLKQIHTEKNTFSCNMDQLKLYQDARDLVLQKLGIYKEAQQKIKDSAQRVLLENLIEQETKQAFVLNNIIEMVERPNQWLEDAEFSHLDEY